MRPSLSLFHSPLKDDGIIICTGQLAIISYCLLHKYSLVVEILTTEDSTWVDSTVEFYKNEIVSLLN